MRGRRRIVIVQSPRRAQGAAQPHLRAVHLHQLHRVGQRYRQSVPQHMLLRNQLERQPILALMHLDQRLVRGQQGLCLGDGQRIGGDDVQIAGNPCARA